MPYCSLSVMMSTEFCLFFGASSEARPLPRGLGGGASSPVVARPCAPRALGESRRAALRRYCPREADIAGPSPLPPSPLCLGKDRRVLPFNTRRVGLLPLGLASHSVYIEIFFSNPCHTIGGELAGFFGTPPPPPWGEAWAGVAKSSAPGADGTGFFSMDGFVPFPGSVAGAGSLQRIFERS